MLEKERARGSFLKRIKRPMDTEVARLSCLFEVPCGFYSPKSAKTEKLRRVQPCSEASLRTWRSDLIGWRSLTRYTNNNYKRKRRAHFGKF